VIIDIPSPVLWMIAGFCFGRAVEALIKVIAYLDRETRGPFDSKKD
jgi:hypothetical protein